MENVLKQIEEFTRDAHGSQRRKFVEEMYIEHPIRVMKMCSTVTKEVSVLAAALLHDVIEDTNIGVDKMKEFLLGVMNSAEAEKTTRLVVELTDVYTNAAYPKWNRRIRKEKENERLKTTSMDSRTIKYADIIDNATGIAGNDFAPKLLHEMRTNLKSIPGGNESLYQQAVRIVDDGIKQLRKEYK
jgi:(p)ppGpp synthase/HD superfamily hydrolase